MSATTNRQPIEEHWAAKGRLDRSVQETEFTEDARWWPPVSGAQRGQAIRPVEGGPKLAEMLTTLSLRLYAPERSWTIELLTIESAPVALVGLFRGGTIGKAVVRLYQ